MSSPFLGEIRAFAFNFAPQGWALCNGNVLPISQYTALFALLGTQYGGDGRSTFALPNLQGSIAISAGQGSGLQPYQQGQSGGTTTVTLTTNQIPPHTHALPVGTARAEVAIPGPGVYLSGDARGEKPVFVSATVHTANPVAMAASGFGGSGQGHNNLMPYLVLNYCIATSGIFPSRQ